MAKKYFKDENYDIDYMKEYLDKGGHAESWHSLF